MSVMNEIAITATKRTVTGKQVNKLRSTGQLPAVLYGHNTETQQLQVNEKDFAKTLKQAGESSVVNLIVDGKTTPVLIHDVQNHYLNDQPIHVDFFAINMSEKIKVKVPLHFTGESLAVKSLGGTLVRNLLEVEVECLPTDLPREIEVDISSLNTFEDAIRVSDFKISDKVTILAPAEDVAVTVAPPRTEEEMNELAQVPIAEDVTKVEGVVKPEAPSEGEAGADVKAEKAEKKEKKE